MQKLTIKQKLFLKELLSTKNGTEAAFRTYNCKNRATAAQIAYENLRKPEIHREVKSCFKANELSLELVLKSLVEIAVNGAKTNIKAADSIRANQLLLRLAGQL